MSSFPHTKIAILITVIILACNISVAQYLYKNDSSIRHRIQQEERPAYLISEAIQKAKRNRTNQVLIPAGVYLISEGFVLPDNTALSGAGMDRTVLKLMRNLPPRRNEKTHTAVFTGESAFSLSHHGSTQHISIRNLTIDLSAASADSGNKSLPILGGIRLINPSGCLIDSVRIIRPPRFGIGLYATKTGEQCESNLVSNCMIELEDSWYEVKNDSFIKPKQQSLIGIELSSFHGNSHNGAGKYLSRQNPFYLPSKTRDNKFVNNRISGGSHGISLSNACGNLISQNEISGCSHRGIIIISTSDSNSIENNRINAIGSTGIHLAYGCDFNRILENTIDTVFGIEGDGIKSYINCNFSIIRGNRISHFAKNGIRVAHGANGNEISGNHIYGDGKKDQTGIAVISNLKRQFNEGLTFGSKLTAKENICSENEISQTDKGVIVNDEMKIGGSAENNRIGENRFTQVRDKELRKD